MLNIDPWLFGISAQGIGTVGMVISFIVMYVVSRATAEPPSRFRSLWRTFAIRAARQRRRRTTKSAKKCRFDTNSD